MKTCLKKLQAKQEDSQNVTQENFELQDQLDESQHAYQALITEISSLKSEFEKLQCELNKSNCENESLKKSSANLNQKLITKQDEVNILKSHFENSKKIFKEKVTQLRKEFNDKIIDYAKQIYPSYVDKDRMVFDESVQSTGLK